MLPLAGRHPIASTEQIEIAVGPGETTALPSNYDRAMRYLRAVAIRVMTAQERAEKVLTQLEAALRVAQATGAPKDAVEELRAIHRRLHQAGLRQELQGSFF